MTKTTARVRHTEMTETNYLRRCADEPSTEQLPDGLQLAVSALEWMSVHASNGAEYEAGIHAIRTEHAQRVALQRRIAELESERDAALAEVGRITEAGRAHIRRAAAFEAQRDELLSCMHDCVEYVDEEELRHVAAYGEHHHAARLARVREDAKKARAAIARAEGGASASARRAEPADGCGACGDACRSRGSCMLADESPEAAR